MSGISIIRVSKSKVAPALVRPKKNNFTNNASNITKQSSFLIITEALLGIDRLYLLQCNKFVTISSKIYSLVLLCAVLVFVADYVLVGGTTFRVSVITFVTEYLLFVLTGLTSSTKLILFFKNLNTFDETLNIQNDLAITTSKNVLITVTLAIVFINCLELFVLFTIYDVNIGYRVSAFIMFSSHDIEQVFFFIFLRAIYMRMMIVKAHVIKLFDVNSKHKMCNVEKLSEKTRFDVSTLHRVYELLHKCSEQLNSTMNFRILLIFFVSSLVTIILLKLLVSIVQMEVPNVDLHLLTFYVVFRSFKYTVLVVIPCYYSSVTSAQTTTIRTILHDAVNTMPMNKIERRKVKTFFHLTRESDFSYAIFGVIELNMSLPLSYMSLCTTYLIIIIQFSKFID